MKGMQRNVYRFLFPREKEDISSQKEEKPDGDRVFQNFPTEGDEFDQAMTARSANKEAKKLADAMRTRK